MDFKFLTTADYAVQACIPEALWKEWAKYKEVNHLSSFKAFLKQEIENQVEQLPHSFAASKSSKIKVADINFAYDNGSLIKLLRRRGSVLKSGKSSKQIDNKIYENIEANFDKYRRPVIAFVLFEDQEGQQRCFEHFLSSVGYFGNIKWNKSGQALTILGHKMEVQEVNEPTDINWIYQGNSNYKIAFRTMLMRIFMTLFLLALLYLSAVIGEHAVRAADRYPSAVECQEIDNQFTDLAVFREFAEHDKEHTLEAIGKGDYQCYCKLHAGAGMLAVYQDPEHLCHEYWRDTINAWLFSQSIAVLIVIMNLVIQGIAMQLTRRIGYRSVSEETHRANYFIFYGQFVNFAFI
jgi:hypothetical protein